MAETIDLVLQVKAQADQAKGEIDNIVSALEKLKSATENSANKEKLQEVINLYKDAGKEIETSATALQKLASVDLGKAAEKLKDFHGKILDVTNGILSFGKSAITEAGAIGKLERNISALGQASGKTKGEMSELLSYLKDFSLSKTGFSTQDIYESAKALEKWNLDVKEILPMASDLAATFGTELSSATTALGRAFTGQRGGLTLLAREYGFTEEKLKAYGAAVTEAGAIDDESIKTRQAIIAIMKEMSGASANMADTYGASQKQLQNQLNDFKAEIGKGITPALKEYTKTLTELAKMLNSLSDEQKKSISDFILWAGGITLALGGLSKTLTAITEMKVALTALGAAMTPQILILGGIVAALTAVGVEIYKAIKAWEDLEKKKADNIYKESQKLTQGFKDMRSAIEEVNKTPLEIAIAGDVGKKLDNIEARIRSIRDLQTSENKDTLWSSAPEWLQNNDGLIKFPSYGEAMDEIKAKMLELQAIKDKGITPPAEEMQKVEEAYTAIGNSLDKLSPKQASFVKDLEASMAKLKESQSPTIQAQANIKTLGEVFSSVGKSIKKSIEDAGKTKIIDKSYVTAQIQDFNELVKLGESTVEKKKEWLQKALKDERTDADAKRAIKLELKKIEEDSLRDIEKSQKDSIEKKKKAEEEYRNRLKELSEKAAQEGKERQEKALQEEKERKQKQIAWGEELLRKEEGQREEADRKAKDAEDRRVEANKELEKILSDIGQTETEKAISRIKEQADRFREAKADEIKLEEFTQKSLQKLQTETTEHFKEQEKQKREEIKETLKSIEDIEKQQEENRKNRDDIIFGFDNTSPVMSMSDAFDPNRKSKWDRAAELDKENLKLEEDKQKYQSKLAQQKAEEKKLTDELEKAQTALNTALGGTELAYNAISKSSPWDAEAQKVKNLTSEISKMNVTATGGGSSSVGGAISTPQGQSGETSSLGDTKPRLSTMLSGVMSVLGNASNSLNSSTSNISNTTVNNRNSSQQASTVNNYTTLNIDGRSTAANAEVARGTQQILSAAAQAKYLTRRS